MLKEGKFGLAEAVCLATLAIGTKVFYTSPGFLVRLVGTTGWYMTIISALTSMLGFGFVILLLKRFPNKGLVEIFELSMGRVLGFAFAVIFSFQFLRETSVLVRECAEVLRTYSFTETSTGSIVGAMVLAVGISTVLGLESIARVAKLSAYFILAGFVLVLILAAQNYDTDNIFPILGYGFDQTFRHGVVRSSYYGSVIVLAFFAPSLQNLATVKKAGLLTLVISGAVVASSLLCLQLIFPYYTGQELTDPMYALARNIKYGYFFTRIDILFIFIWNVSSIVGFSVLFYASVSIFCKAFRLTDARPVVPPMMILLFCMALLPRDISTIIYKSVQGARENSWVFYYGLPLIALITAAVRKKKDVGTNA